MTAFLRKFQRRALIAYLTEDEVDALLAACDLGTWTRRRDHALLLLATQTRLRISELTGLTLQSLRLRRSSSDWRASR